MPALAGPSPLLRLQSDERLIALIRRGQHAAFETLFSRYQSRLLSFCRHMLGSREDAEDVLQEVFTAAFNAILADEREINVRPWLYRIARNRSLNHLRRASAIGVDSMDIHFADHGLSTSDRVMRRESFRQLIGDVQQLPETQRTALLLREIDALSYEQIATAMETTVPSVKSLLVRARISLAEAAEARKLNCEEVRLELGEIAEGLAKLSPPIRRHMRDCDRCKAFRKHLKANNHALAAILPVGPLLLLKKLALTKLGSTASAGAGHVAGAGGATAGMGATAAASAGAASAGAGVTVGGASFGSLVTAGAGALATKAVAGLAAAALVTAGAVEAGHTGRPVHRRHHHNSSLAATTYPPAVHRLTADVPVVIRSTPQPLSTGDATRGKLAKSGVDRSASHANVKRDHTPTVAAPPPGSLTTADPSSKPAEPIGPDKAPVTQVTQVTSETTALPTTTAVPTPSAPTVADTTTGAAPADASAQPPAPTPPTTSATTTTPQPPPSVAEEQPTTSSTPNPATPPPAGPEPGAGATATTP
jgi:RNA polymerase sigma factor (sigma-70 family)